MDVSKIKLVAFDLDGTLTQHKTPLCDEHRAVLDQLAKKYKLVMLGAGMCRRIFDQMGQYPIDIYGNYGMQMALYRPDQKDIEIVENITLPCDEESVDKRVTMLREKYGFTEYTGENVEYHASGAVTFPLLGTKAKQEDKLAFDPDRKKRRAIYEDVKQVFRDYIVFIGGSSSFDMTPAPYNKAYALDRYCQLYGLQHDEVVYVGDDYGPGGNDESIYLSDFNYIEIDNYLDFPKLMEPLLKEGTDMKNYWTQNDKNIFVAAHRGWSEKYPENSMLAFQKAAELGVDQIEMDIRVTKDDQLVVFHDPTVDRVSNGTGKVSDFTLAELQQLDIGIKKGTEFAGTRIPTLIEFLDFIKTLPDMTVDFELKEFDNDGPLSEEHQALCDRVLDLIAEYNLEDRCVINSFGGNLHEYIQKKYGDKYKHHVFFPADQNKGATYDPYSYAYCCCVFDNKKESFEMLRSKGVRTWAGASVKDAATVDWAIEMGAELITCNNPDVVLQLLRERGYHK